MDGERREALRWSLQFVIFEVASDFTPELLRREWSPVESLLDRWCRGKAILR